jgi:hypothetical protein
MKKSDLKAFIKEEILSEMALQEMATFYKIKGDKEEAKNAISKEKEKYKEGTTLYNTLDTLEKKGEIDYVKLAKELGKDTATFNNPKSRKVLEKDLEQFIEPVKSKKGPKADPNKPKKEPSDKGRGRPKSEKKKDSVSTTSKLGGRKYYTKKDGDNTDEPTDAELRKLASSGGDIGRGKDAKLKQQEKSKLVKAFLKDLRDKGIVDASNKILDKEKYDAAWAEEKPKIQAKVSQINENFERRDPNYYIDMLDNLIQDYSYPKIVAKARILSAELMDIINNPEMFDLDEASKEEVENQRDLNKELEKTAKISKEIGLGESKKKQ